MLKKKFIYILAVLAFISCGKKDNNSNANKNNNIKTKEKNTSLFAIWEKEKEDIQYKLDLSSVSLNKDSSVKYFYTDKKNNFTFKCSGEMKFVGTQFSGKIEDPSFKFSYDNESSDVFKIKERNKAYFFCFGVKSLFKNTYYHFENGQLSFCDSESKCLEYK
ncbi:hypothetical protein GCL60_00225 [Silvanigrella paludirubra]|uniref:Lipoprotein n=1 Tax=Silvanigrella paludirubra TaxID=2499159 RepID=A0A6N6VYU0_9BACT|nr:hypothetical protein [Silvanigrella paludirubra]KAB8040376.1 hypothetical protein GCL60_00225 [Silvanigrella paludirubra]